MIPLGNFCARDADCQLGCCAFYNQVCADPLEAQINEAEGGCGFGTARRNCDVSSLVGNGICRADAVISENVKTQGVKAAAGLVARLNRLPLRVNEPIKLLRIPVVNRGVRPLAPL
jgi:hypothetical protein